MWNWLRASTQYELAFLDGRHAVQRKSYVEIVKGGESLHLLSRGGNSQGTMFLDWLGQALRAVEGQ
jgi:hypothetical protein